MVIAHVREGHVFHFPILSRMHDENVRPVDLQVRVMRVDGKWDAFAEFIDKDKYPDCLGRLVENSDHFFLRRKRKALNVERGFIHEIERLRASQSSGPTN
jgi:hypothetical protein